jgi:hypothetical protein
MIRHPKRHELLAFFGDTDRLVGIRNEAIKACVFRSKLTTKSGLFTKEKAWQL